jgi:VanZ family protein
LKPTSGHNTGQRGRLNRILIALLLVTGFLAALTALLPDDPGTLLGGATGHIILPAMFAFGLCARWSIFTVRRAAIVVGCCVLIGVLAELAQLVVGRNVQFTDVLADLAGGVLGVGLAGLLQRRSQDIRVLATSGLAVLSAAIVAGPLRVSVPVERWRLCRNFDQNFEASENEDLRLATRSANTSFTADNNPVNTTYGPNRSTAAATRTLLREIRCSESFAVRAVVTPANIEQAGPRRIVAFSSSSALDDQALVVGIEQGAMQVRVRYARTDVEFFLIENVFAPNTPRVIEVSQVDGVLRVIVDGKTRFETRPKRSSLATWNLTLPFNVGDEYSDDRPFEGLIEDVTIRAVP